MWTSKIYKNVTLMTVPCGTPISVDYFFKHTSDVTEDIPLLFSHRENLLVSSCMYCVLYGGRGVNFSRRNREEMKGSDWAVAERVPLSRFCRRSLLLIPVLLFPCPASRDSSSALLLLALFCPILPSSLRPRFASQ